MPLGHCREAARDHSPGLQAWVGHPYDIALKGRPNGFDSDLGFGIGADVSNVRAATDIGATVLSPPRRSPLQGGVIGDGSPGLKPWAMIYSRFAANPGER
jgi:hypothetical protein